LEFFQVDKPMIGLLIGIYFPFAGPFVMSVNVVNKYI